MNQLLNGHESEALVACFIGHEGHGKSTLAATLALIFPDCGAPTVQQSSNNNPGETTKDTQADPIVSFDYRGRTGSWRLLDAPANGGRMETIFGAISTLRAAILVVAVSEGPMAQTALHVSLARRAGVQTVVPVLTKIDEVDDEELIDLVEGETLELLNSEGFSNCQDAAILASPISASKGDQKAIAGLRQILTQLKS